MSKIAEQKALEAYPIKIDRIYYGLPLINGAEPFTDDINIPLRDAYIKGYDQAFQDFMENACEWLSKNARNYFSAYTTSNKLIEDFKTYMQDEKVKVTHWMEIPSLEGGEK